MRREFQGTTFAHGEHGGVRHTPGPGAPRRSRPGISDGLGQVTSCHLSVVTGETWTDHLICCSSLSLAGGPSKIASVVDIVVDQDF